MGEFNAGYNCPYMFSQFTPPEYKIPVGLTDKIDAISPQVLRFPGGTLANEYDRLKGGYGRPTDRAAFNFIERYKEMVGGLKSKPKTAYVANIYQALLKPLEYKYWLDGTLLGIRETRAEYVELGNELNIDGVWLQLPDKPGFYGMFNYISEADYLKRLRIKGEEYLKMCDLYIQAIRELETEIRKTHPAYTIKIGLPFGNPFTLRNKEWNRILRTYTKQDAEIFHIYLTTRTRFETQHEIEKCIAGNKKPVWITEWSWVHGNGMNGVVQNTGDVNMVYYANFFKDFVAICRMNPKIEMICQHQLFGDNIYSVIKK